ncbi:MAG: hypothetical protein D6788_09905 [Planctomycetota bacterium]|nr:MAG: hypothetical protein D6788_09905 [Planctomycetota bacterium]
MWEPNRQAGMVIVGAVLFAGTGAGCRQKPVVKEGDVPPVPVQTVTLYGMTLDEQAGPKQVVYALLRAIRDDFLASTPKERREALRREMQLAATDVLEAINRTTMTREEFIREVVDLWTPTVSHYVHDFETEWEKAEPRLVVGPTRPLKGLDLETERCAVYMQVDDPSGDPAARVVMSVYLARDKGFWRVTHLGFRHDRRSLQPDTKAQPVLSPDGASQKRGASGA